MSNSQTSGSAVVDIIIVFGISVAAYFAEIWARNAGYIALGDDSKGVLAVLAGVFCALALVVIRKQRFSAIGFRRPKRWATVPLWAAGILVAYIIAQIAAPILVSQYFELPEPDLSRHDEIYKNLPAALTLALLLPFTASIPEEIIYRGFLMNRLTSVFGAGAFGSVLTVLVAGLIFGSVHFQWGLGGMISTSIMGVVWGTAFLLCGRNLWIVIFAHSLGHILFVVQLYFTPPA